jgi:hypothetical protein
MAVNDKNTGRVERMVRGFAVRSWFAAVFAISFAISCTGNAGLQLGKNNAPADVLAAVANEKVEHGWEKQVIVGIQGSTGTATGLDTYLAKTEVAGKCQLQSNYTNATVKVIQAETIKCADAETREQAEDLLREKSTNLIVAPDKEIAVQSYGIRVADEPISSVQWALPAIHLQEAWNRLSIKNDRVIVAVIDSGIDSAHIEFTGKIVGGYDFVNNTGTPQDTNGHGTHVAGIIAGHANRVGMAGVAPNVFIMPLKIIAQDGKGSVSNLLKAIRYAIDNGAHVINISAAFYDSGEHQAEYLSILTSYVNYAASKGVLIVASQGNRPLRWFFPRKYRVFCQ